MWKSGEKNVSTFLFWFTYTQIIPICKTSFRFQENESMNSVYLKILSKWENMLKQGENGVKGSEKP